MERAPSDSQEVPPRIAGGLAVGAVALVAGALLFTARGDPMRGVLPLAERLLVLAGAGALATLLAGLHRARGRLVGAEQALRRAELRNLALEHRSRRLDRARLELFEYASHHSVPEILQRTLDELSELTGSRIGFYHFVEADQRTLSLQAWSTRTIREFCTARAEGMHYPLDMAGVWVDCVRERRPVIHNDYASLPHRRGLPAGHAAVVRELLVPVVRDERIVAIVGVGNKPADYGDDDVELVSQLADACWDLTGRKRAEEAQRQLEAQLRQAQKLESIGRMAGGVAHDFNNLLTVILTCARNVEEALRAGERGELDEVEEIRKCGERARALTQRLLAFARRQDFEPVPVDLVAAIRSVENLLRRVVGDDVALRVDVQAGLWPVLFDPAMLEQVFVNLAINARDAMPNGGSLFIDARNAVVEAGAAERRREDHPGDWVRLRVRDTGVGLAPEVRAHLFEPFFTTKDAGKGTGLGLAMVLGVVSAAGGHIHVSGEPDEGTTFEICLPRTGVQGAATAPPPEPSGRSPRGEGETLLVVEDDPRVRWVIARALRSAGYVALEAGNGAEALGLVHRGDGRIRLVLSDVQMPGLDGFAMAEAMRRLRPRLPVLFVSGAADDGARAARPGDDLLPKPFEKEDLLEKVRSILDRDSDRPAPPGGNLT